MFRICFYSTITLGNVLTNRVTSQQLVQTLCLNSRRRISLATFYIIMQQVWSSVGPAVL